MIFKNVKFRQTTYSSFAGAVDIVASSRLLCVVVKYSHCLRIPKFGLAITESSMDLYFDGTRQ
jgi:hypothetical protein